MAAAVSKGSSSGSATLPGSQYLREDAPNFFGMFLTLHVLSLCLFLGLVLMMDLRLLGLAHRETPITQIQKRLFPWQLVGAIVMSISGLVLFYAQPVLYWGKGFYWIKMLVVMPLAMLNLLVFHFTTYRSVAGVGHRAEPAARRQAGRRAVDRAVGGGAGFRTIGRLRLVDHR